MNIDLKQMRFLFLLLSLTLVWVDSNFFAHTQNNIHISSQRDCSDLANHVDHSHSENLEDDSFIYNLNTRTNNQPDIELLPDLTLFNIPNFAASRSRPKSGGSTSRMRARSVFLKRLNI